MTHVLLLRLAGPMQSWGTGSRLQIRRTDGYPSKSGALGLLLCAMGVNRESAPKALEALIRLEMGVRIDRPGDFDWDYHTAGAGMGIRKAEGGVKFTASTKEPETLLSRRQYLLDASFLVALMGDESVVEQAAEALRKPRWPVFLGRKCCVPTEPVLAGVVQQPDIKAALESVPLLHDGDIQHGSTTTLDAVIEHRPGLAPPPSARLVYDVPRHLLNPSHGPRWVVPTTVNVRCEPAPRAARRGPERKPVDYASPQWKAVRADRLRLDGGLCVFCKSEAQEVHHITYENAGQERLEDLRSLCRICHDACTQLEYGQDMRLRRVDPLDPELRDAILRQVGLLITGRRLGQRRRILESARMPAPDFLADVPG